jgi:hypothetical protein
VTVIGRGDLSPPRRHHRRGRHRIAALVLLVVTLAVAGWFGWRWWDGRDKHPSVAALSSCVQPTHPPAPAPPRSVSLTVSNGTRRNGLAHTVADQLRTRGFRVVHVGNARHARRTLLTYAATDRAAAETVREHVPDVLLAPSGAAPAGRLQLVIGASFRRLATPKQAEAVHAHDVAAASPAPSPCPSSSP